MSPYREARSYERVSRPQNRWIAATWCRLVGHQWFLLLVPEAKTDDDLPRFCTNCRVVDLRTATPEAYREAVQRFLEFCERGCREGL